MVGALSMRWHGNSSSTRRSCTPSILITRRCSMASSRTTAWRLRQSSGSSTLAARPQAVLPTTQHCSWRYTGLVRRRARQLRWRIMCFGWQRRRIVSWRGRGTWRYRSAGRSSRIRAVHRRRSYLRHSHSCVENLNFGDVSLMAFGWTTLTADGRHYS